VHVGQVKGVEEMLQLTGRALAASITVPTESVTGPFRGIVEPPQVPLRFLDFFGTVPFQGRVASFMRRNGGIANAAITPHGAVKPQAAISFDPVEVTAETHASFLKVDRQDLDDVDGLLVSAENALTYGVLHSVEAALIAEIIGTTGVLAPDVSGDVNTPDKLLSATGALTAVGVTPNFIAVNPADYVTALKERESTAGGYVAGPPWAVLPPVVQSAALSVGQALAGDSRIAATLGVRQGISLHVGQEQDDMTRNVVTVLVEGRWAPMVRVPSALALIAI
jgi:hypothetical protein